MGNATSTPNRTANNTHNAYQGTISNLFEKNLAFQLYNPVYEQTLFVSDVDKIKQDFIVESHSDTFEEKNHFYLKKIDGTNWNGYALYHSESGGYVFVSNDKSDSDHIVESHPYLKEKRNCFIFQQQKDFLYTIYNPQYKEYIFVSNDTKGSQNQNHVILSHPHLNEERNLFEIQLIYKINQKDTPIINIMDDSKLCIFCIENEKDCVVVPCGHICFCRQCKEENYDGNDNATCPICRCKIEKIIRTYQ